MNYDYETLTEILDELNDIKKEYDRIGDVSLKKYKFPEHINELIKTNHEIIKSVITFYYNDAIIKLGKGISLEKADA